MMSNKKNNGNKNYSQTYLMFISFIYNTLDIIMKAVKKNEGKETIICKIEKFIQKFKAIRLLAYVLILFWLIILISPIRNDNYIR